MFGVPRSRFPSLFFGLPPCASRPRRSVTYLLHSGGRFRSGTSVFPRLAPEEILEVHNRRRSFIPNFTVRFRPSDPDRGLKDAFMAVCSRLFCVPSSWPLMVDNSPLRRALARTFSCAKALRTHPKQRHCRRSTLLRIDPSVTV